MENKTKLAAIILGFGQVTGKILSLIFLFRFANDLGNISLYSYAYIPFSIFADLSSFGLIPGTSKSIARLISKNEKEKAYYLLKKGSILCIWFGIFFFIFMLLFSRSILSVSLFGSAYEGDFENIRYNLLLASISLFIIPLNQFYKGYLQGFMKMYPTCIAIVLENLVRLILYVIFYQKIDNVIEVIHMVFYINFVSYFVSFLFLFIFILKYYKKKKQKFKAINYLLKISIPYGITTMFFTIYQLVDSITLSVLLPVEGYYTAYMFETIRLIFLPIILAQSLGGTLNPKINCLYQENHKKEAKLVAEKSTGFIIKLLIPIIFIFKLFSKEIYSLFYSQENGALILYHISDLILFFGLYKVLIGIVFGLPRSHYIIIATIISGAAKYSLNYLLIPKYGYLGAIYATEIAIVICILEAYYVLYLEQINIFVKSLKTLLKAFISGFLSIFVVVFFRMAYSIKEYSVYLNIVLYSIMLVGIYYICNWVLSKILSKEIFSA